MLTSTIRTLLETTIERRRNRVQIPRHAAPGFRNDAAPLFREITAPGFRDQAAP